MKFLKSLFSWFSKPKPEDLPVADTPEDVTAPATTTDTEKLKALLIALGHDIEAEWERAVSLAQKAV
ncbi:MAG: hypothetical protein JWP42_4016 [Pseudomonas sp.]|nr:hypothetical protein [Pseudomonas sp.]